MRSSGSSLHASKAVLLTASVFASLLTFLFIYSVGGLSDCSAAVVVDAGHHRPHPQADFQRPVLGEGGDGPTAPQRALDAAARFASPSSPEAAREGDRRKPEVEPGPSPTTGAEPRTYDEAVEWVASLLQRGVFHEEMHIPMLRHVNRNDVRHLPFGSNPSMQRTYDFMALNRRDSATRMGNMQNIPVLGLMCTANDFQIMLNLICSIDVVVEEYVAVVNGPGDLARIFLGAAARLLPGYLHVTAYEENEGVSRGWNIAMERAFVHNNPPKRSVVIANSDIMIPFGRIGRVMEQLHKDSAMLIMRFHDFAFFGFKVEAFRLLGYSDENFYPGYAEDVDLHLRMVALGKGSNQFLGKSSLNSEHYTSANIKHDSRIRAQFNHGQGARVDYISKKWGVSLFGYTDFQFARPHSHPFNNPKIRMNNSWILDPEMRECLRQARANCRFNMKLIKQLEVN